MRELLLVAVGGAVGATLRHLVNVGFTSRGFVGFPWHTLVVNVTGAFLLGLLAACAAEKGTLDPRLVLLLGTGVLGGFTTFSAYSYETVVLLEDGGAALAVVNVTVSTVAGIAAAWGGLAIGRSL